MDLIIGFCTKIFKGVARTKVTIMKVKSLPTQMKIDSALPNLRFRGKMLFSCAKPTYDKGQEISEVFFLSSIPLKNQRHISPVSALASKNWLNQKSRKHFIMLNSPQLKFMFSKKAKKNYEIFNVNLTFTW